MSQCDQISGVWWFVKRMGIIMTGNRCHRKMTIMTLIYDDDVDPRKALTCAKIRQLGRLESESTGA